MKKSFIFTMKPNLGNFPELKSAKANTPIAKFVTLDTPSSVNILRNVPLLKSSEVVRPSVRI